MKKRTRLLILAAALALAAAATGGFFYLKSARFHAWLLDSLVARLERATGMQGTLGSLEFDIRRGAFRITDFALAPRPGRQGFLRLQIAAIEGALSLRTLWKPAVDLRELTVIRPRIMLTSGEGGGGFNAGRFESLLAGSLKLAARKVVLHQGWLEWNHKRIPLDLTLREFQCTFGHRNDPLSYDILLSYEEGRILWAGRDIVYGLSARLHLFTSGLDIESFRVKRPQSTVEGRGTLRNWDSPVLSLQYEGSIGEGDFYLADPAFAQVRGTVAVSAAILWDGAGFHMRGSFAMPRGEYRLVKFRVEVGNFEIRDRTLSLRNVRGTAGGGAFDLSGVVQLSRANPESHRMKISVLGMPLRAGAQILAMPKLALDNTTDAEIAVRWREGERDLEFDATCRLHAPEVAGASGTPLAGDLEFDYRRGSWKIHRIALKSPDSAIEILENTDGRSAAKLDTSRPQEVFQLARRVITALDRELERHPDILDLSGRYHLQGDLFLSLPDEAGYVGRVKVDGGRWRGIEIDSLEAAASWKNGTVRFDMLRARRGAQGLEGELRIDFPAAEGEPAAVTARGNLNGISLEQVRRAGLPIPAGFEGTVNGSIDFTAEKGSYGGSGSLKVEKGSLEGTAFDLLSADVELAGARLQILRGRIRRGPATVDASGTVDIEKQELDLNARVAAFPLQELPVPGAAAPALGGRGEADLRIRGTLENPSVDGTAELKELRYGSWDFGHAHTKLDLRDGVLRLDLSVESELGRLGGLASVGIREGYALRARLMLEEWNLQKTLQAGLPPLLSDLSTALHGRVDIQGVLRDPGSLSAEGELDGARFRVRDYELRNEDKIRFRIAERKLRLEPTRIVGEGSGITVSGIIPLEAAGALDLVLKGSLNIQSLPRLSRGTTASGAADLDVRIGGSLRDPTIIGHALLRDVVLAHESLPFLLSSMQGRLTFSSNAVVLENVRGSLGGGSVTINGVVELRAAEVNTMNLQFSLRRARLPFPQGFRSTVDADLSLRGDRAAQALAGKVVVLRSDYLADFNLIEQLAVQAPARSEPQGTSPLLAGTGLNISIVTQEGLYIDNELARVRAGANLMLRGTFGYPVVTGRVEAVEGTIFFRGNRFEIINATADFSELRPLDPNLEIRAEADVKRYRLRLDVRGNLRDPRFSLSSDPPLPTVEIVLLLTAGISREETAGRTTLSDEDLMRQGAASLISAGLTGALDRRVQRIFGLYSFRVDPYWIGPQKDPTARVTVSERLSKDLTVTYSRNLSTNEEQVVIVEWDLTRNLTLVASQDEKGDFGVDLRFRKRLR